MNFDRNFPRARPGSAMGTRSSTPSTTSSADDVTGNRSTPLATKTVVELFQDCQKAIKDRDGAAKWLIAKGLVPPGVTPSLKLLTTGLLMLASDTPAKEMATKGLVALAYYAEAIEEDSLHERVAAALAASLESNLQSIVKEAVKNIDAGAAEAVQTMATSAEDKLNALDTACEKLGQITDGIQAGTTPGTSRLQSVSYATVAVEGMEGRLSDEQERVLAKVRLQERQTLVNGAGVVDDDGKRLPTKAVMERVEMALRGMETDGQLELPEGLRPVAVDVLENGGLIVEWPSKAHADWIRENGHAQIFATGLNIGAELKLRTFKVVAECVPVDCVPGEEMRTIKELNGLEDGTVVDAKWIKPATKRRPGQEVAHVLIAFRTPQAANQAIRNRLTVGGRRVIVRKSVPEPFRCAKCLRFRHSAKECRELVEQCGTCGSTKHLTKECKVTYTNAFFCKLCDRNGHATWAKDCPAYRAEVSALMRRNPDLQNRFFPTSDPSSWPREGPTTTTHHEDDPSGLATQWTFDQQIEQQGGWTMAGPRASQKKRAATARVARENGAPPLTQSLLTGTNSEPLGFRAPLTNA